MDLKFVADLKREMLDNPTTDVQPLLCTVKLKSGEKFNCGLKEGYKYESVGGNNSREALQQLLSENRSNRAFTHRLCAVYLNDMNDKYILRLAGQHIRATQVSHAVTDWDKV